MDQLFSYILLHSHPALDAHVKVSDNELSVRVIIPMSPELRLKPDLILNLVMRFGLALIFSLLWDWFKTWFET